MCGIAGSVNYSLDSGKLNTSLIHRGPDEQTSFLDNNVQFYHYRLSILDKEGGKQPMTYGPLTIIYNGEIYNHLEVRRKLNLTCTTKSDTETILQAYFSIGKECLKEFDGMFAFAIYDRRDKRIFLARDRAGEKPLYYYSNSEVFVFASELNAICQQIELEVNYNSIIQFLVYGSFHAEMTPYLCVNELEPGSYAYVDTLTSDIFVNRWWTIEDFYLSERLNFTNDECLKQVDQMLHTAIKRRIETSDMEVGAFLSGGIDSGLVVSIASEYNTSLRTFTVSFQGQFNEAPLAKMVAQKYSTKHTEISISFDSLKDDIENILYNYGEPFYDDSAIPSYYVSMEAKKYLTVILTGDGSDEIFGGYRRYLPFSKYDFFRSPVILRNFTNILKTLMPKADNKMSLYSHFNRFVGITSSKGVNAYFSATTDIFAGYDKFFLFGPPNRKMNISKTFNRINSYKLSGLEKIMCLDFNAILPDILLPKIDIATMAHSLEGRTPFFSKEILEFAPRLENNQKINGKQTKWLLRLLAQKYLPDTLVHQPKRGFEVPLKKWVDSELREIIGDYLTSTDSYVINFIDRTFVLKLLQKQLKVSEEKRAKMLYTLFALDVWHKKCVRK